MITQHGQPRPVRPTGTAGCHVTSPVIISWPTAIFILWSNVPSGSSLCNVQRLKRLVKQYFVYQLSSSLRISDTYAMHVGLRTAIGVNALQTLGVLPFPSPLFLPSPPSPFPFHPPNPARGSGERCMLPQRVRAEPGHQTHLRQNGFLSVTVIIV